MNDDDIKRQSLARAHDAMKDKGKITNSAIVTQWLKNAAAIERRLPPGQRLARGHHRISDILDPRTSTERTAEINETNIRLRKQGQHKTAWETLLAAYDLAGADKGPTAQEIADHGVVVAQLCEMAGYWKRRDMVALWQFAEGKRDPDILAYTEKLDAADEAREAPRARKLTVKKPRTEEALRQQRSRMIAFLAHDLRNFMPGSGLAPKSDQMSQAG